MMNNDSSIENSLSASDHRLLPYLPYLLQDLFELGCIPEITIQIIEKNRAFLKVPMRILELGCGKGATLIQLSRKFEIDAVGIDLFEPFIHDAINIRDNLGIKTIDFKVMDITDAVCTYRDFDLVIYGCDTDVLGNESDALQKVSRCCAENGLILYESATASISILEYIFSKSNLAVIDSIVHDPAHMKEINTLNTAKIKRRADELTAQFPGKKELFQMYIDAQIKECEILENEMIGITYLLKKAT